MVLIAQARMGKGFHHLSPTKLEAALTLALELTERYRVVPVAVRDSIVSALSREGIPPTALEVAHRLNCSALCFALAERFVHLVRVEVVLRWGPSFEPEQRGVGYALARYARRDSDEPLYDPVLLEAAQRALATALGDSMLYAQREPPFRVYPAAVLAVSSIAYVDDPHLPPWQLFAQKTVTSYDAVLNIIDTARFHPRFVVCDIDTRDSIYATGKWLEPENYNPPTSLELQLLERMGVEHIVSGSFYRIPNGGQLQLGLYRLRRKGDTVIPELLRSTEALVTEDSVSAFRTTLRHLTGQLLWQSL